MNLKPVAIIKKAINILNEVKNTRIEILNTSSDSGRHDGKCTVRFEKDGVQTSGHFNEAWFDPERLDLVIIKNYLEEFPANATDEEKAIIKIMTYIYYGALENEHI